MERTNNIIIKGIDGSRIKYKNFEGRVSQLNGNGMKKFTLELDEDVALYIKERGFNVKTKERENGDLFYDLDIFISYDNYPPNIYAVTGNVKKLLNDNTVRQLQGADIINVDLCFKPYNWKVNGKTGVKAYVKYMYVTIEEDPFADDYAYLDDNGDFDYEED